jgi:hypothetical protein
VGLASNPGGTTLGGGLTVAASGGVATFSGLILIKAASGYTIYVSGSGPISTTTHLDQTQLQIPSLPAVHDPGVVFAYADIQDAIDEGNNRGVVKID